MKKAVIIILVLFMSFTYFIVPRVISNPIYHDISHEKFNEMKEEAQKGDCSTMFNLYRYYELYEHKEDECVLLKELIKCDFKNKHYPMMYKGNKCKEIVDLNKSSLSQLKQRSVFEYIFVHIKYYPY